MHANIDVHSRISIAELPKYGMKGIEILQSHCKDMIFAENLDMTGSFRKSHIKEENLQ